jgi:hypothetical protein
MGQYKVSAASASYISISDGGQNLSQATVEHLQIFYLTSSDQTSLCDSWLEHGWHTDRAIARVMRRRRRSGSLCAMLSTDHGQTSRMQRLTTTAVVSEQFQPDMAPFYCHVQRKYELRFQWSKIGLRLCRSELSRTWGISPTKLGDLTEMSREYTAIYWWLHISIRFHWNPNTMII